MIRREIAKNVFLTEIEGSYKKSRLSIYMASPLKRSNLTATAILPFILERGTAALPDMTLLKRRQNALYGANLFTGYYSNAFSRIIEGGVEGVDGALIKGVEDISAQRVKLLLDVLYDPYIKDGAFPDELVDIEREKLREVIRSVINDKRDYCSKLLTEAFFEGDERAFPVDGFEKDLDSITGASLYGDYKNIMSNSKLEIIYVGSKFAGLAEVILSEVSSRAAASVKEITAIPKRDEKAVVEVLEVEQDKLAMAFTTGRVFDKNELVVLRVASALLGAAPTSRLFMNVREKQSLCYSILSQPSYKAGGGLIIECGIDHANAARAKAASIAELENLAQSGPTDKELKEIKLLFGNILSGVYDSSSALGNYIYSTIVRYGEAMMPEQELEIINSVTPDEVKSVLSDMHLNASCLLCNG